MAELSEKQIDNYMDDLIKTIHHLESQIDKMKRCEICKHYYGNGICGMGKSGEVLRPCELWRFDE